MISLSFTCDILASGTYSGGRGSPRIGGTAVTKEVYVCGKDNYNKIIATLSDEIKEKFKRSQLKKLKTAEKVLELIDECISKKNVDGISRAQRLCVMLYLY